MQRVHLFLAFERRLPEAPGCAETCVVHQQRKAIVKPDSFGGDSEILVGGEVRLQDFDAGPGIRRELRRELFQAIFAPGNEKQVVFRRQPPRKNSADATGCTGNGDECSGQTGLPVQIGTCKKEQEFLLPSS